MPELINATPGPDVPRGTLSIEELHNLLKVQRRPWAATEVRTQTGPALGVTRVGSNRRVLIQTSDDIFALVMWLNELEAEVLQELPPVRPSQNV